MESTKQQITQSKLKELLHYDKHTGVFVWVIDNMNASHKGSIAGYINKGHGYRIISITINKERHNLLAHRAAWLYEYGTFPSKHIDHINHNKEDNRIVNLREADSLINGKNRSLSKMNTTGVTGVYWHKKRSMWVSKICVRRKLIHLGYFIDKNEAICARLHANRLYKFHPNHGKC